MKALAHRHYLVAFYVTLGVAIGLLITSFLLPPQGEIHPSVLRSAALLCFWPALAFVHVAMKSGKTARLQHGNTTVTVGDDDSPGDVPMDDENDDYDGDN